MDSSLVTGLLTIILILMMFKCVSGKKASAGGCCGGTEGKKHGKRPSSVEAHSLHNRIHMMEQENEQLKSEIRTLKNQ